MTQISVRIKREEGKLKNKLTQRFINLYHRSMTDRGLTKNSTFVSFLKTKQEKKMSERLNILSTLCFRDLAKLNLLMVVRF